MKSSKFVEELKNKSQAELAQELVAAKKELFNLRFQNATNQLDNTARMNTPGTVDDNWSWRLAPGQVTEALGEELLAVTMRYGRANWDALNAKNEK